MKLVFGKGINDARYRTQYKDTDNKIIRCPFYDRWSNMLRRCYSQKYHITFPSYIGCEVCEEWLIFSNFKSWMQSQDWKGRELDKDLLSNSRVYSPETCVFVSKAVNYALYSERPSNNGLPLGVSPSYNKYQKFPYFRARSGKIWIGSFTDPMEAHKSWQNYIINKFQNLVEEQVDNRVIEALNSIINSITREMQLGLETKEIKGGYK